MASKKDKLLENAQRFVLKGQIDKAIKEYQQIVALDPREIRFRQRLAELLVRDNRREEAIAEYEDIGKHYADNSYFLKAIAVYKQIQRLDSANPAVSHTLAVLNQRQGLAGNALAEYNHTVRLLEQQGALDQAVTVVQEMLALDGENSAVHLKHAELLFATGQHDPSYRAFSDLFKRLVQGGDEGAAERVSARMAELFPGQEEHEVELLTMRIQKGELDAPLATLRQSLARNERNLKGWRLLCEVLRRKGAKGEMQGALERMATLFPGDLSVLTDTVRCELDCGMPGKAAELLGAHVDDFLAAGKGGELEALFLALPAEMRAEPQVREGLRKVYEAAGDWDKLNALRAPVLQGAGTPFDAFPAPAAAEDAHQPAWEEDIELDFDDHLPEEGAEPVSAAAEAAAAGSMELEWPEEPEPFLAQEHPQVTSAPADAGAAELPWGEIELPEAQEEGGAADLAWVDPGDLELSLPEASPFGEEESLTLDLDAAHDAHDEELPGEEIPAFPEQEPPLPEEVAVAEPLQEARPEESDGDLSWEDVFPGSLMAEAEVDLEDAESHYDLGIAYLEMGRFDAALQEFAVAAANPRRRLDCLILQGMSHRNKGDEGRAEDLLKKGLLVADLTAQERLTLRYELAALYESQGGVDRAVALYRQISTADPSFRDVAQKLARLVGEEPVDIIDLEVEEVL